jgi:hypothetical protein
MFVDDEKALNDEQIIKMFVKLVQENGEVRLNKNDLLLSDRCVIDFTRRRFSGRKLYLLLDSSANEKHLQKGNISIKRSGGYIIFSYASGQAQKEADAISHFIDLVKQKKEIKLNPSRPSSSPEVAKLMQESNLSDIDFGYMLDEYNELIRIDLLVSERANMRIYSAQ